MESCSLVPPIRCGAEEEPSAHIPCECKALASLIYTYLGSFFSDPEDIKSLKSGGHLELEQRNRAPLTWYQITGHEGSVLRSRCFGTARARTQLLIEI